MKGSLHDVIKVVGGTKILHRSNISSNYASLKLNPQQHLNTRIKSTKCETYAKFQRLLFRTFHAVANLLVLININGVIIHIHEISNEGSNYATDICHT